jgi:Tfp pilus assembly protein PilF
VLSSAGFAMPKIWPWSNAEKTQTAPPVRSSFGAQPYAVGRAPQPSGWDKFKDTITGKPLVEAVKKGSAAVMPADKPTSSASQFDSFASNKPTGPPSPQLYASFAQLAERQGNIEGARRYYQQAVGVDAKDISVLLSWAHLEDRQNNLREAESLYQRALAAEPTNARALNDLGLCYARQGKLSQAATTLQSAIQSQPTKALYRNNLATVLVEVGRRQEALAQLQAVHPPAVANYNLGFLLERRGDRADAISCYQTALAMDSNMSAAQSALAKLDGGYMIAAETTPVPDYPGTAYSASQVTRVGQSSVAPYQQTSGYNQQPYNTAVRPSPPVARPLPPIHPY